MFCNFTTALVNSSLPSSFYGASVTLIPKPDKYITIKEKKFNITDEYRYKNLQYNTNKLNPKRIKRIIHHDQEGLNPGMPGFFNLSKSINVTGHIAKLKDKNYIVISTDAEKDLTKFNTHV